MMPDCSQPHGSNAAALTTIRISAKLTWPDLSLQVCRYDLCCPRKNTGCRTKRWPYHLSYERFVHIQDGVFHTKPQKILHNKRSLLRSENLRTDGAPLWRKEAKPYFIDLRTTAPELKKFLQITGPGGNVSRDSGVDRDLRPGNVFGNSFIGCRLAPFIVVCLKSINGDNDVQSS